MALPLAQSAPPGKELEDEGRGVREKGSLSLMGRAVNEPSSSEPATSSRTAGASEPRWI